MINKKYNIQILPHGEKYTASEGSSLLESLRFNGVPIRSDCAGKGSCGKCNVNIWLNGNSSESVNACSHYINSDLSIEVPESSKEISQRLTKPSIVLNGSFISKMKARDAAKPKFGLAVDLGTTTIAIYLCEMTKGKVLSSVSAKNPQFIFGDDVMSRIGAVDDDIGNLNILQSLVVDLIEQQGKRLLSRHKMERENLEMILVGNPTMNHLFLGVNPETIGKAPYLPQFYKPKLITSNDIGLGLPCSKIQTLPQISGFIGSDILSAAIAVELEDQPVGTLLIDLGTNGELMLKGKNGYVATSCATGPAFEGASLSCGIQATPGAISSVKISQKNALPQIHLIDKENYKSVKPTGICGTGVISAVSQFCEYAIVDSSGRFVDDKDIVPLSTGSNNINRYTFVEGIDAAFGCPIFIDQKDIRAIQLGKAALITGIDFLLQEEQLENPDKIIIAGAFGSNLNIQDLITLGMIPNIDLSCIEVSGNSAGSGAIMSLCVPEYLNNAKHISAKMRVIDYSTNPKFQNSFIDNLGFPF